MFKKILKIFAILLPLKYMSDIYFILSIISGCFLAGFVGALTGLGGGIIVVPLLSIVLGIDLNYAIGASLISVIATSSGAATAFLKKGITNLRIGLFLEIATTIGAVIGAVIAVYIASKNAINIIFGSVLIFSAINGARKKRKTHSVPESRWAKRLRLNASYEDKGKVVPYKVTNVWGGFSMMSLAGILSGLLGIGSGALKVLAMDNIMKMPFKVSTTTSNFMIGVTAAASAVVYLQKGYIVPEIAAPVMIGVLAGSRIGAKVLTYVDTYWLKRVFILIITIIGIQMMYKGFK